MSGPSAAKSSVQFFPILWEKENFTSSINGQDEDGDGSDYTRNSKSRLSASADRRGIFNRYAHIAGMSKFKADFRFAPFSSVARNLKESGPTSDAFDMVFALAGITSAFEYLAGADMDIEATFRPRKDDDRPMIEVKVNAEDICNAWFSPTDGSLTFGVCEKMHMAADGDVLLHELGHWLLNKLNPKLLEPTDVITDTWWPVPHKLYAGEQDAIHEGFADAFAAIINGNPVIGEDTWVFTGKKPGEGLRSVNNRAKRKGIGSEAHERGKVYGGFFWSLYRKIGKMSEGIGGKADAAEIMLALMWEHALHYSVAHPTTDKFVDAMLAGANALFNAERIPLDPFEVRDAILDEAFARELVDKRYVEERKKADDAEIPEGFMFQRRSDASLRSAEDAIDVFKKDGKTEFKGPEVSWTASGLKEFHEQLYTTASGLKVEVIGSGVTVEKVRPKGMRFKRGGEFVHVFTEGVRDLSKPGAVDEAINLAEKAALSKLAAAVHSLEKKAAAELSATKKKRAAGDEARMKTGLLHRDVAALKSAGAEFAPGGGKAARLVLLPGKSTLSWRFDAGEITGYVDAKSGKVTVVRSYLVD